jgi:phosphate:Na+ symporter
VTPAFQVLGGLALFLFGVRMLSQGMEKIAGNKIQEWLDRLTGRRVKGALFGAAATALLQSSSLMMITLLGLVNAHLISLEQAVGVMLGQEVGTTLTAQIVAFDVGDFSLLFVALGFVLSEFARRRRWGEYGEILMGLGVLFVGMDLMSGALEVLAELPGVERWLAEMGRNFPAGVLAGTIATAIVQSSSAITGLVVAMGMSQAITLPGAIALLLGANIGTCIDTQLVAALRLSRPAWRASVAQIFINVLGVLLFVPFLGPFTELVRSSAADLARQIANAHTIFNVAVSLVLLPFSKQIARLAERIVPRTPDEEKPKLTAFIDDAQHSLPAVALREALRELNRIGETTADMIEHSCRALVEDDMGAAQWVLEKESEFVDAVCVLLEGFVNRLMQESLTVAQQSRCFQLKNLITDNQRVGDLTENLVQEAQKKVAHDVSFSPQALQELTELFEHTHRTYVCALRSVEGVDETLARRACRLEDEFDSLYLEARQAHVDRLEAGICQPEAEVIFIEALRNLERIADHADNLGISVLRNRYAARRGD